MDANSFLCRHGADSCKLMSLAQVTRVQLEIFFVIRHRFVPTAPLWFRDFSCLILFLSLFFIHGEFESARPDNMRHDGAVWWLPSSFGSRKSHPRTRQAQEKLSSLLLVSMMCSRETWNPRVPRVMTHEVHDELERSRKSR